MRCGRLARGRRAQRNRLRTRAPLRNKLSRVCAQRGSKAGATCGKCARGKEETRRVVARIERKPAQKQLISSLGNTGALFTAVLSFPRGGSHGTVSAEIIFGVQAISPTYADALNFPPPPPKPATTTTARLLPPSLRARASQHHLPRAFCPAAPFTSSASPPASLLVRQAASLPAHHPASQPACQATSLPASFTYASRHSFYVVP